MAKSKRTAKSTERRLSRLLMSSGYKPLAFIGRAIEGFGLGIVASFLVGAGCVYALAVLDLLPGAPAGPVEADPDQVTLRGKVINADGEPQEGFKIGVLQDRLHGPFLTDDGKFNIDVSRRDRYNLIVFPPWGTYPAMYYGDQPTSSNDESELVLRGPLRNFPSDLGRAEGTVLDAEGDPVRGRVEINGLTRIIDNQGYFQIRNIPLGEATVVIRDHDGRILKQDTVQLRPEASTPLHYDGLETP